MAQFTSIPKSEQENVLAVYWQMMKDQEEKAYDSKNQLDRLLVEGAYRLWNRVTGSDLKPRWM